jgi:hypothetical protein
MQRIKERWKTTKIDSEYISSEKLKGYAQVFQTQIFSRKLKIVDLGLTHYFQEEEAESIQFVYALFQRMVHQ